MEGSGQRDKIQVSEETAEILTAAGLGRWLVPREDTVSIMGKGEMKTFWLQGSSSVENTSLPSSSTAEETGESKQPTKKKLISESAELEIAEVKKENKALDERIVRRADWVAELLIKLLKKVIAKRGAGRGGTALFGRRQNRKVDESVFMQRDSTVLEEVQEHIALPKYDPSCKLEQDADSIVLDPIVEEQIHAYVTAVASMYRKNPFHNFEHGMWKKSTNIMNCTWSLPISSLPLFVQHLM